MPIEMQTFQRPGLLAIEPAAFGLPFPIWLPPSAPYELIGSMAVVDVSGPLTYDGFCTESYRGIRQRFEAALASDAVTVVVRYRTPGGEVSGAFDLARMLPKLAKQAGKRYVAFTETQCASAGYALACGADEIVLSDTANIGSIGVIAVFQEVTKADAAAGVHFEIFASGERKADGNPHQKWTEPARASAQAGIDASAAIFFELVAANRKVKAGPLEGAVFMGAEAVKKGLADRVESWDALVKRLSGASANAPGATQPSDSGLAAAQASASNMPNDEKDDPKDAKAWRKALAKAADEGDEDAKKALKALDAKAGAAKAEDDKGPPKDDEKDDEKDKPKPPAGKKAEAEAATPVASASLDPTVAALLDQVRAQGEALKAMADRDAANARAAYLATRPDLPAKLVAAMADKPLAEVKAIVDAIPVTGNPLVPKLAASVPHGDKLAGGHEAPELAAQLDARMGITSGYTLGVKEDEFTQTFGVRVPTAPAAAEVPK